MKPGGTVYEFSERPERSRKDVLTLESRAIESNKETVRTESAVQANAREDIDANRERNRICLGDTEYLDALHAVVRLRGRLP